MCQRKSHRRSELLYIQILAFEFVLPVRPKQSVSPVLSAYIPAPRHTRVHKLDYHELDADAVKLFWALWAHELRWVLTTVYNMYYPWAARIPLEQNMYHPVIEAIIRTTFMTYADATWRLEKKRDAAFGRRGRRCYSPIRYQW